MLEEREMVVGLEKWIAGVEGVTVAPNERVEALLKRIGDKGIRALENL